jgi:amidohydrolase
MINEVLKRKADEYENYVIQLRREFHENPEIASKEEWTSKRIIQEIEKLNLPYEMVSTTGLIATLDTGREGKHVALRADIDALPMNENVNNLNSERTCISKKEGYMHACGHDAHMAMAIGSMKVLNDIKDDLNGIIYFCFEEGEETGTGKYGMLEVLGKKKIDAVWGIHVYSGLESGKISVEEGPRMAGAAGIDVTVIGKGGHGSRPDLSISPINAAAGMIQNLNSAFVNQIDANETVTLGIGTINSGSLSNIIPDTANFTGSMRFFNVEEGEKAVKILREVCESTAKMHHCEVEYKENYVEVLVEPVINDSKYSALAVESLNEVLPEGTVDLCPKWYASESYSEYTKRYPAVLAFLGINNKEKGTGAEHHNQYFDVDEDVLKIGVLSTTKFATSVINQK